MDAPPAVTLGPEDLRQRLMARFARWLDETLETEPPPSGLAAEILDELEQGPADRVPGDCDLYALHAAMTALTQEVKLQGRAFRDLSGRLAAAPPELAPGEEEEADDAADAIDAVEPMLDLLLDLRDRLARGLEVAGTHLDAAARKRAGWLAALLDGDARHAALLDATRAVAEGTRLALARLDEALRAQGVLPVACRGRPFDPRTMKAVDVVSGSGAADGEVVTVHRAGYERHGETVRVAEVAVARHK